MREPGTPPVVGIIGGSGVYGIDGLAPGARRHVETPWGTPSDALACAELDGARLVFLARHGSGHRLPPSEINARANIDALKRAGVTEIISLSAVGSLREDLAPGALVLVDQFVDRTVGRARSFFGAGLAAHVGLADPTCRRLRRALADAGAAAGIATVTGGCYLAIEGPQFSTRAESRLYRSQGCDVIGMTNMPEARLAREAELCYATVAMVTDYDCWRADTAVVTVDRVVAVLAAAAGRATALARAALPGLGARRTACGEGCHTALDGALATAADRRDPALAARLDAVAGRVLDGPGRR